MKPSTIIGLLLGVALVVALLGPSADRDLLASQGFSKLLGGEAVELRDGGIEGVEDSFLLALQERVDAAGGATVAATLRYADGVATEAFERSWNSGLNTYNSWRAGEGLSTLSRADVGTAGALALTIDIGFLPAGTAPALGAFEPGGDDVGYLVTFEDGTQRSSPQTWDVPGREALLPPLLAILVALAFRQVLVALFVGILVGATIAAAGGDTSITGFLAALPQGFVDVFRVYLWSELTDTFRVEVLGFVIALVAMVGIMSKSGGVQGLVNLLLVFARTVRSTLLVTWGMGILIFFDDYANCLLVGNTMRPLTDRLRISREKLAYIVDSTAAPIAGISILSTWIAFEVSTFSAQLPGIGLAESEAYSVFIQTIPFRFYCIFTICAVFIGIVMRRDWGPMLAAEIRARETGAVVRPGGLPMVSDEATSIAQKESMTPRWWRGALPIATVLLVTMWRIWVDGGGTEAMANGEPLTLRVIQDVLYAGSGAAPIFVGASIGLIVAIALSTSLAGLVGLVGALLVWEFFGTGVTEWLAQTLGDWVPSPDADAPAAGYGYLAFGAVVTGAGLLIAQLIGRATSGNDSSHHLTAGETTRAGVSSTKALFFAVLILLQAWMIGAVCKDVSTADYLVALLSDALPAVLLPILLFLVSCLVAFATGSSWSTMSILLPNVVALAFAIGSSMEGDGMGMAMVVMCIGAVLEGSIFGDHCSPISDTTVLSSVSSASDHVDHVRTQAPYALVTATIAMLVGYLPSVLLSWWTFPFAIASGVTLLITVQLVIGRRVPDVVDADGTVATAG